MNAMRFVPLLALLFAVACGPAAVAPSAPPTRPTLTARPSERGVVSPVAENTGGDPLACTARVLVAAVPDVFEAEWSPDSRRLAISHIVLKPEPRNVTGTDEDQRLAVIDVASGAVSELGQGSEPKWSASGRLLAYWMDDLDLRIARDGVVVARFRPSVPDVRWVGEALYYFQDDQIRVWTADGTRTVSTLPHALAYPADDAYFSADARMFTISHYAGDRTESRVIGRTATGTTTPIGTPQTRFVEWSPRGHTLLLRSPDTLAVRYEDGHVRSERQSALPGVVHAWTADGRLLLGNVSPTVPGGNTYDTFTVWGDVAGAGAKALLPNLFGIRAFSPDGAHFTGVSRTGLRSMQLEVYRCGAAWQTDLSNDASVKARAAAITGAAGRWLRPTAGAFTNYVQRDHTGIDVAAPYGSLIFAADDGTVSGVGVHEYGGSFVCVTHAGGLVLCGYHVSLVLVRPGEHVARGQPIALIGMSGLTTGPHVHWEAKRDGAIVDPLQH